MMINTKLKIIAILLITSVSNIGVEAQAHTEDNDRLYSALPLGAVVAFDREICPKGWQEYAPAYGRFIRGIDKSREIDPDGRRNPGDLQEDAFMTHQHSWRAHAPGTAGDRGHQSTEYQSPNGNQGWTTQKITSGRHNSDETRPKNVALLYCKRMRQNE